MSLTASLNPLEPRSPGTSSLLSPLGPTSSEQIMKTGALLLQGFIQDRAGRMGGETPELGLEQIPQDASTKKLSECLKRIGDELDSNMELQRMIAAVDTDSPREVFFRVAAEMFSDGNFNWGRVVALFYFASKLVLKVGSCRAKTGAQGPPRSLQALCTKVPELIRTIMRWTLDFLRERLLGWIQDQGGWDGLLSYFGTPTWQTVTIFVAGVLTASLTIWKKMG
ncbi:Apoptosis regulator BAX [Camelus dromedarius]|uniref:Apoptosis regulator BAX n=1 Tax=Camelus dromedarius TaxID=9838 RepID=A0A5N4DT89_CAMDR|nr:Apoptosis regulator BAX [Camelus dromedarius]